MKAKIHEMAIARGPGAKLPTKQELRLLLNASQSTIEDAMAELEDSRIIYRRQGSGIYVSPNINRKTIAIVFNSSLMRANASLFWGTLLDTFAIHAEKRARESSQDFEFYMTSPSIEPHGFLPDHLKRTVRTGTIKGVVGISLSEDDAKWLLDQGVPSVAYAGWSKWTVVTTSDRFIQAGLQVLADQGCRRIEYWGLPRHDDNNPEWYEKTRRDVEAAYSAVGLDLPPTRVGPAPDLLAGSGLPGSEQPHSYRAYTAIKALFGDHTRSHPDGIFIGDDMMANGVVLGLRDLGVRIGVDVKIASHANRSSPILFGTEQHLTLLEYDPSEIADALIHLLDQAMADPDLPETQISVPWRIRQPDGPS